MKLKHILPTVMALVAVSVFAMSQALFAPLAARIAASFGHGLGWSGLLFATGCIPYIVAGLFAGRLVSAAGWHFSASLALGACAVSAVFISHADRFWMACLGLALLGTAAVFVLLAGAGAASALAGVPCAACMPACAAAMGFGAACGALCSGVLVNFGYSWRTIYFAFGVAAAVVAVLHAAIPFPRLAAVRADRWKLEFASALRMQRMYQYFFAVFLYAGAEMLAVGWLAAYMTHALGYTTTIASVAVALVWFCAAVGRLFCVRAADRISPKALSAILCLLLVCALGLCAAVPDGKTFWFAVCFVGVGLSGLWQLLFSAALDANEGGGATLSALLLWACAGQGLFSVAAGAVGSWLGMRTVIVLASLLFLIVAVMFGKVLSRQAPRKRVVQAADEAYWLPDGPDEFSDLDDLDGMDSLDEFATLDRFAALPEYDVFQDDPDLVDDADGMESPVEMGEFADLAEPGEMDAEFLAYPDDAAYEAEGAYAEAPEGYAVPDEQLEPASQEAPAEAGKDSG